MQATVLAFPDAAAVFEAEGVEHQVERVWACPLPPTDPDVLLTGTSEWAHDVAYWKWANHLGILSVAFVDHWKNYGLRFSEGIPDKVAVIDEAMTEGVAEYVPEERIVITGSPAFEREVDEWESLSLRQRWLGDYERIVLYASQPGEEIALEVPDDTRLIVRPHPREREVAEDPYVACLAADAVVGTDSMLLHEAKLLGVPTIRLDRMATTKLFNVPPYGPRQRQVVPNATDNLIRLLGC